MRHNQVSFHLCNMIYFIDSSKISVYLVKIKVVSIISEMISYRKLLSVGMYFLSYKVRNILVTRSF